MRSFILWGGDCKQLISGVYEDTAVLGGARAALGGRGPGTYPERELKWRAGLPPRLHG